MDKDEKEDIYHSILHCTAYKQERSHNTHLQHPYIENDEVILGLFLFDAHLVFKWRMHPSKLYNIEI